jgi:hypothetical protein
MHRDEVLNGRVTLLLVVLLVEFLSGEAAMTLRTRPCAVRAQCYSSSFPAFISLRRSLTWLCTCSKGYMAQEHPTDPTTTTA